MKILLLAEPDSANTRAWVTGLRELGCEIRIASVRVATPSPDHQIIPLGPGWLPPRLRLLTATGDLRQAIADFQPDLLIGYRVTSYGYLAARSGFHPLVIAAQNEQIIYEEHKFWPRTRLLTHFAKFAISRADLLHAWSPHIADGLRRFGAREEQIMILHRGIDTGTFIPSVTPRNHDPESPVLISTRALHAHYRHDLLLRTFAALRQHLPQARLIMVGDGPALPQLQTLANQLGITTAVEFTGRLPAPAVAERLRQADLYVAMIDTEGLSSSLLEACACGIYPAVIDMPASRHFPGKDSALLLDPATSPADGALKIADVLADPARRQVAVAKNLAAVREKFSRDANLCRFVERYQSLSTQIAPRS